MAARKKDARPDPAAVADELLWGDLSPMELTIARAIRAHKVTPVHGQVGTHRCAYCHETVNAAGANIVNVERFHQAKVIIRALTGGGE